MDRFTLVGSIWVGGAIGGCLGMLNMVSWMSFAGTHHVDWAGPLSFLMFVVGSALGAAVFFICNARDTG